MAFFTDTINKQIATQLNVADQIAKQKQMDVDNAIKMYSLGKMYGDNKLEGQGTRGMMNQGLISGLFTQGMDGLRGLAQTMGADVKGVERHAHNVDNSLTNSFIPDSEGGLTAEQQAHNERISQLRNMSTTDRIKAAAFRAFDEKYPGATDEDKERLFNRFYRTSSGKIKNRKNLRAEDVGDYQRHRAALDEEAKGELFKDEDAELRKEMKRHGIDKMSEFSGSHSNMRNQNLKMHKALIDFYVKKKNWDKAQELNDAYVQNEMNIDKHWGMGGKREYKSLFKRPTGAGVSTKTENKGFNVGGQFYTVAMRPGEVLNPQIIMKRLQSQNPEGYEAYKLALARGEKINLIDADKNERANLPHEDENLEDRKAEKFEEDVKKAAAWYNITDAGKDSKFNTSAISRPDADFSIGLKRVPRHAVITNPETARAVARSLKTSVPALLARLKSSDPVWFANWEKRRDAQQAGY